MGLIVTGLAGDGDRAYQGGTARDKLTPPLCWPTSQTRLLDHRRNPLEENIPRAYGIRGNPTPHMR